MIAAGDDDDCIFLYRVDETVGVVDAAAVGTGKIAGEFFGFSEAAVAVSCDIFDEIIDFFECFFILCPPKKIIVPTGIGENFIHLR